MSSLESILKRLFVEPVEAACAAPSLDESSVRVEERAWIAEAVPKRRAEFLTARACARRALARLGVAAGPLLPHTDRSPRWPTGVVGSITHCNTTCAVVVGWEARVRGIGIDIEEGPLAPALYELVCTPGERRWLATQAADSRGIMAKMLFSGKEAIFKCQYPRTRTYLDFQDVELRVDRERMTFVATATCSASELHGIIERIRGRIHCSEELIVATCAWR